MRFYFHNPFGSAVKKRGAPPTTLPLLIHRDLELIGRKFLTPEDYKDLKALVLDKRGWNAMIAVTVTRLVDSNLKRRAKRKKDGENLLMVSETADESDLKRRRVEEVAELPLTDTPSNTSNDFPDDEVSMLNHVVSAVHEPASIARTRKRRSILSTIPDEKPMAKKQRHQVDVMVHVAPDIERINRRADCRTVIDNSVL